MNDSHPQVGDKLLGSRYNLIRQFKGSVDGERVYLGEPGSCRFCGTRDAACFRKTAHTFPEALGNTWVISRDECDDCNTKLFYDEELAKAVSPFLTLGGVKGKRNKVRATGRTGGGSHIEQRRDGGRRRIAIAVSEGDPADFVAGDPSTGKLRLTTPIAAVPFKPRFAYKALAKMAVALMPRDELPNYRKLIAWLREPHDAEDFPVFEVGLSFASIGNAPPLVTGQLLRRTDPADNVPHMLFLFSAGSVCLQLDLMSDHKEDHTPPFPRGFLKISYANVIGDGAGRNLRIAYGPPIHLNWASSHPTPQPIEAMILDFDQRTCEGRFTPVFLEQR